MGESPMTLVKDLFGCRLSYAVILLMIKLQDVVRPILLPFPSHKEVVGMQSAYMVWLVLRGPGIQCHT